MQSEKNCIDKLKILVLLEVLTIPKIADDISYE